MHTHTRTVENAMSAGLYIICDIELYKLNDVIWFSSLPPTSTAAAYSQQLYSQSPQWKRYDFVYEEKGKLH